jgi:hypothetical protein
MRENFYAMLLLSSLFGRALTYFLDSCRIDFCVFRSLKAFAATEFNKIFLGK